MSDEFERFNTNSEDQNNSSERTSHTQDGTSVEYGPRFDSRYSYGSTAVKRSSNSRVIAVLVALGVIFAALCGVGGVLLGGYLSGGDGSSIDSGDGSLGGDSSMAPGQRADNVVIYETDANAVATDGSVASVAEKSAASVVEIMTTATSNYNPNKTVSGAGSGVIIAESTEQSFTYVITNNHVVEGYETIRVRTTDGTEYDAAVIGTDWCSDIAVLRIEAKDLSVATFASSDSLKLGQEVVAIGNPLGSLGGSVTNGIISGLSRTITIEGIPMTLLQTNAAINPRNSGGGLFDMNGNLIGIVNAKSVGEEVDNIGFAIPSSTAKAMAEQIIAQGYVSGRADLGFSFGNSTTTSGLTVYSYAYNNEVTTPIESGYILYAVTVDGKPVEIASIDDYRGILASLGIGDTVQATIYKPVSSGFFTQYKSFTVTLTVHEYKPS